VWGTSNCSLIYDDDDYDDDDGVDDDGVDDDNVNFPNKNINAQKHKHLI
jgi:hypothetical protein